MSNARVTTGEELSRRWSVNCKHALYNKSGTWYHQLERFPGALFDEHGYVLFTTKESFLNSPYLRIRQDVNVPGGLKSIPGYVMALDESQSNLVAESPVFITTRKPWSRDELLVLLNLYEKIPFGKFDQGNPVLIDIAARIQRTPGSVAMKLSNLASLDERLAARGIKGLTGASALDRAVWAEFHAEHDTLAPESEALLAQLLTGNADTPIEVLPEVIIVLRIPEGPNESATSVKVRRGQRYFRQAVLNAYGSHCAVTGLGIRDLLVASHIIPWNVAEEHRLDPQNGIALNALHDKAFDRGLITFDTDLKMVCSSSLRDHYATEAIAQNFKAYEGQPLSLPTEAAGPKPEYLAYHRENIFGPQRPGSR